MRHIQLMLIYILTLITLGATTVNGYYVYMQTSDVDVKSIERLSIIQSNRDMKTSVFVFLYSIISIT